MNVNKTNLNLELKQVHLPSNTYLFFMKIIFLHSYKTIGEYYTVISLKSYNFRRQFMLMDLLQNWYIYSIYPS